MIILGAMTVVHNRFFYSFERMSPISGTLLYFGCLGEIWGRILPRKDPNMTTQSVGKLDAGPIRNMGDGVHDDNPQIPEKLRDADEALNFIVEMTVGLRQLAEHHRLPFVSYLLEMAVLEASRGLKKGLEG